MQIALHTVWLIVILIPASSAKRPAPTPTLGDQTVNRLLSRLDLDRPSLEKVKAAGNDSSIAARELLAYYRSRSSFKHPVDRSRRIDLRGKYASNSQLQTADNALKHILIASPSYPPHQFGPDIDWSLQPVPDDEWRWQLHRMSSWNALAKAYWHTGDENYARQYAAQLLDWIVDNPHDADHKYAWRSIEAGIRGHSWIDHFQHFLDSHSFTPQVLTAFMLSAADHADYLYKVLAAVQRSSNWRLMEAEGLAFIAMTFGEFKDADQWLKRAIDRLNAEIKLQVRPDGMHFEQCFSYHTGCIKWFSRTAQLARLNGRGHTFGSDYHSTLERMCEALMKLALPDGKSTQFGDDHHRVNTRATLRRWADLFDRDDFRYLATAGQQGRPPDALAYTLSDSGFYSLRSSWRHDAICLVLKCGPDGGWHCQPDNGTFELYAGRRRLMPDSGTYIYSGDRHGRAWFRQTQVHQTLTLQGSNSAYHPRLRLFKPGARLDALVVENQSYRDLLHRRAVMFVDKKFFVLVDDAIGPAGGPVYLHFQLAPGSMVLDDSALTARTDLPDGYNVLVKAMPQPGLSLVAQQGQVSFKYGHKQPRPAFRFQITKDAHAAVVRFVTVLIPYDGPVPKSDISVISHPQPGSDRVELELRVNGQTSQLGYDLTKNHAWLR